MKTKKRILSIILAILLIASHLSMAGVTVKADPSEDPSDISIIISEAEEPSAENEEALDEEGESSAVPENEIEEEAADPEKEEPAAPEEEEAAQEEEAASDEGEAAPEGILEERDSSGTCGDNITWTLNSSGVLSLKGTGNIPDFQEGFPSFYSEREKITSVFIGGGITGIGYAAFYGLSKMKKVTIPVTVTEILVRAFQNCSSLEEVTIPYAVEIVGGNAFEGCSSLKTVRFQGKAPILGPNVFRNLSLTAYYLPIDSWTSDKQQNYGGTITWVADNKVGDNVTWSLSGGTLTLSGTGETYEYSYSSRPAYYSYRTEILSVAVNSGVTRLGSYLFSGLDSLQKVELPSGIKTIGDDTFYCCESLLTIDLPSGVTSIGNEAFSYCESLQKVGLKSGLTSIKQDAFYYCTALQSINLPTGLKSIGELAFANASSLPEITIPASVNEIGDYAFVHCHSLKKILVDSANSAFTSDNGILFSKQKTRIICYPAGKTDSNYTIPEGTGGIARGAFNSNKYIVTVTIPEGVTFEGNGVFEHCEKLEKVTLGEGVEKLPDYSFNYCYALKEITIPASVTYIGLCVFQGDTGLKTVYFKGAPPEIDGNAFRGVTATAYFPDSMIDLWTEDVRKNYGGNITWVARHVDVTGIKFKKTSVEIPVGKTEKLQVVFTPEDAFANLTWKSSAPGIATVDDKGNVTAKKVGKTTISATASIGGKDVTIKCTVNVLFKDVTNKSYAPYTAIYALNAQGIVAGFSDGTFKPNDPVTRGQVLVFLWRSAGKPTPNSTTITFKDAGEIKALGNQYVSAVLWGVEQGITEGFTDNTFRPNTNCTRGQIVTFLWRYKGKPAPKSGYNGSFPDVPKTHTFYKAVSWAASYKITTGFSDGTFRPSAECTRGQCVAFIYRMLNL